MEKDIKNKNKLLKTFFWCSVWLSIFVICMKIYYTNLNLSTLTEIENFIAYSPLYDVLIVLCFIIAITFLIVLKLKNEKIFQNKKIIICTFFILLLVTLTILIINNISEKNIVTEPIFTDDLVREMFNARFISYIGTELSLPEVRQLITEVISNNSMREHCVNITYNGEIYIEINDMSQLRNTINNKGKYNIYCEYDVEGYINNIILEKK